MLMEKTNADYWRHIPVNSVFTINSDKDHYINYIVRSFNKLQDIHNPGIEWWIYYLEAPTSNKILICNLIEDNGEDILDLGLYDVLSEANALTKKELIEKDKTWFAEIPSDCTSNYIDYSSTVRKISHEDSFIDIHYELMTRTPGYQTSPDEAVCNSLLFQYVTLDKYKNNLMILLEEGVSQEDEAGNAYAKEEGGLVKMFIGHRISTENIEVDVGD